MASKEFQALQERMAAPSPPDPSITLEQKRAGIDAVMGQLPVAEGVVATDRRWGDVPVVECVADAGGPVVVYLHGGGFRMVSALAYRSFGSHLAKAMGARVVVVDYRLAPESPFPAALDDTLEVYEALLEDGVDPSRIVLAGDSAGGNLSAAATLALKDNDRPLPAGVICCSPWADLTNSAETYTSRAEADRLFSLQSATEASELYLPPGADRRNPLVSPVFGDWTGCPPALILVGDAEVLLDDSIALDRAMSAAGVDATLRVYPEMPHVWMTNYPAYPEAVEAVEEMAAFARRVTAPTG